MFYNTLNEQRQLTGVMVGLETDPGLRKFLETTKAQLEERYEKVGALLNSTISPSELRRMACTVLVIS
jgi:hypothetical protein